MFWAHQRIVAFTDLTSISQNVSSHDEIATHNLVKVTIVHRVPDFMIFAVPKSIIFEKSTFMVTLE